MVHQSAVDIGCNGSVRRRPSSNIKSDKRFLLLYVLKVGMYQWQIVLAKPEQVFYLWLSNILANEGELYICKVFPLWIRVRIAIYRQRAQDCIVDCSQKQLWAVFSILDRQVLNGYSLISFFKIFSVHFVWLWHFHRIAVIYIANWDLITVPGSLHNCPVKLSQWTKPRLASDRNQTNRPDVAFYLSTSFPWHCRNVLSGSF